MSVTDGTVSPTRVGGLVIGAVDHINGSGAEPSGFVVTKHELEQVARYWEEEYWRNGFHCFAWQQSGSTEWRIAQYSTDRREAIAEVLGTQRLDEIHHEVLTAFQARTDPTAWRLFFTGTKAEQDAYFTQQHLLMDQFETNPFEVSIRFPHSQEVSQLVSFLCSWPKETRDGGPCTSVRCRYATRAEADDLAQRVAALRVPDLAVEIVARQLEVPLEENGH